MSLSAPILFAASIFSSQNAHNDLVTQLNLAWEERAVFRSAIGRYFDNHVDICDRLKVKYSYRDLEPAWYRFGALASRVRKTDLRLDLEIAIDDANHRNKKETETDGCPDSEKRISDVERGEIESRILATPTLVDAIEKAEIAALAKLQ